MGGTFSTSSSSSDPSSDANRDASTAAFTLSALMPSARPSRGPGGSFPARARSGLDDRASSPMGDANATRAGRGFATAAADVDARARVGTQRVGRRGATAPALACIANIAHVQARCAERSERRCRYPPAQTSE